MRKMSKSFGNYIALEDRPAEMFGKLMSISDDLMMRYYELLTVGDLTDIKCQHPMEAKKALAEHLVRQYHGETGAEEARADFQQRFQKRDFPDQPDAEVHLTETDFPDVQNLSLPIVEVLMRTGLVPSKGEARRLLTQQAIQVDGEKLTDPNASLMFERGRKYPLKIGKRKIAMIHVDK